MRIGIYGGTFNPPHKGHIKAAQTAIRELALDKLLVIPANTPPHKELPKEDPGGEMRFQMTKLTFEEMPACEVLDLELRREGPSYTIETIRELKKRYPEDTFVLLMGTDMLLYIEHWKDFELLFKEVTIASFARKKDEEEKLSSFAAYLKERYGVTVHLVPNEAFDISSSEIRAMLPKRQGSDTVHEKVYALIVQKGLYGAKPEFSWLRKKAYEMLVPKRIPHVEGCEETAVKLAEHWGADIEEAREAAILHDITKKDDLTSQLLLCEEYGIMLDALEKDEVKLLHSKTGAGIAKHCFGSSDEVYEAIFWHTTGKENMSLLEKIIYMADYIEPNRDFEGLRELRELAYKDLDAAMYMGIKMSLEDMRARGIEPHTRSQSAMEWFETQKKQGEGTKSTI